MGPFSVQALAMAVSVVGRDTLAQNTRRPRAWLASTVEWARLGKSRAVSRASGASMSEDNHQIVLAEIPQDKLAPDHFKSAVAARPSPGEGEVLLKVLYVSLDA